MDKNIHNLLLNGVFAYGLITIIILELRCEHMYEHIMCWVFAFLWGVMVTLNKV